MGHERDIKIFTRIQFLDLEITTTLLMKVVLGISISSVTENVAMAQGHENAMAIFL